MKKTREYLKYILPCVAVILVVLVALGVLDFGAAFGQMAFAAIVATPGLDGKGQHLSGEGNQLSVVNANNFSPDMISHAYDRQVVMMGLGGIPINTFMRYLPHKNVNNMRYEYFSVDLRQIKAITTGAAVAAGGEQQKIEVGALHSIFDINDQIFFEGIDGYKNGAAAATVGLPYNAIVIGKTDDAVPKLIVQPINGKPIANKQGVTECLAVPTGTSVYRITNLVDEAQNYNEANTAYPTPTEQYMQIFMTTVSETELSQTEEKNINYGIEQQNQLSLHQMMKEEEAAILLGVKGYTKQMQPKVRWVYTFDGFEAQAIKGGSPLIEKSKAALIANNGETELVGLYRKVFRGNSGSDTRYMFCGSGVIETLSKVKLSDKNYIIKNEGDYVQFGVRFTKMSSMFGTLLVYQHPVADEYGREDVAYIVDLAYADKLIRESLRSDDVNEAAFRGKIKRVIETFSPIFKYSKTHAIFKLKA